MQFSRSILALTLAALLTGSVRAEEDPTKALAVWDYDWTGDGYPDRVYLATYADRQEVQLQPWTPDSAVQWPKPVTLFSLPNTDPRRLRDFLFEVGDRGYVKNVWFTFADREGRAVYHEPLQLINDGKGRFARVRSTYANAPTV